MNRFYIAALVGAVLGAGLGLIPALFAGPFILIWLLANESPLTALTLLCTICLVLFLLPRTRRAAGGVLRQFGQVFWFVLIVPTALVSSLVATSVLKEHVSQMVREYEITQTEQKSVETGALELPVAYTAPVMLKDGRIMLAGNWGVHGDNPRKVTIIESTAQSTPSIVSHSKSRNYVEGIKPGSQIAHGWFWSRVNEAPALGVLPRGFFMPNGSVVVVGGLRLPEVKGGEPVIPAQHWNALTGKWSVIPNLNLSVGTLENTEMLEDIAQRANGDLVSFDSSNPAYENGRTGVRYWDHATGKVQGLDALRKYRVEFSTLELADERIAVIGGRTHVDLIALDKDCADCPDEYISIGDVQETRSTEVYSFATRHWVPGPSSRHPGGAAVRLSDGRIVKVGTKNGNVSALEIADAKFTGWKPASSPPSNVSLSFKKAVALDMRVLVLGYALGPNNPGLVWNAENDQWSVWRPESTLYTDQVLVLDGKKVFLLGGRREQHMTYMSVEVP